MTDERVGPFDQTTLFRTHSRAALAAIARRLRHVRIVPGFRGDPDFLSVTVLTKDRQAALDGVEQLGFGPVVRGLARTYRDGTIVVSVHGERAAVGPGASFSIGGNEPGTDWTFGERDVRLAERLEARLDGAAWVGGYREPDHAITPATYPWFFDRERAAPD